MSRKAKTVTIQDLSESSFATAADAFLGRVFVKTVDHAVRVQNDIVPKPPRLERRVVASELPGVIQAQVVILA